MKPVKKAFSPHIVKIDSFQKGDTMVTELQYAVAPGMIWTFRSGVNLKAIENAIRSGQISGPMVEGLFGSIWKGIKKVGKAIGVDKVIKTAKKVLKNPVVSAIFPPAGIAKATLDVASTLSTAVLAKKKGHPKANKVLALAIAKAKKAGMDKNQASSAVKSADKIYTLIVRPK